MQRMMRMRRRGFGRRLVCELFMLRKIVFSVFLGIVSFCLCVAEERKPVGLNCDLKSPPSSAGVVPTHSALLRIYPRAIDMPLNYSGCQALFFEDDGQWKVGLMEFVGGHLRRSWAPGVNNPKQDACRYEKGKVVHGDSKTCRRDNSDDMLFMKSYAPECIRLFDNSSLSNDEESRLLSACETLN